MEKHELRFVEVDGEAGEGEPGVDPVPSGRNLGNGREEGGAGGIDVTVIDIKREIVVVPVIGGAEEGRSGEHGEDGGKGGALWGSLVDAKGIGGVSVKGQVDGTVGHEAPDPVTCVGVNAEAGKSVDSEGGVKMIKKPRDVKEEDRSHTARSNHLLSFMTECGGGIRSRMVGAGSELSGTEEVEVVDVGAEPVRHHLLEELPTALE